MPQRRRSNRRDDLDPLVNSALSAFWRLDARWRATVVVLLVACAIGGLAYYHWQHSHPQSSGGATAGGENSPNLLLGNPSNATNSPASRANYLMVKPYYALSYNDATGTPNWVSWRVIEDDLGEAPRKLTFDTDTTLPSVFYHVTHKDYSGSGFDRGHMCPHSDRAATQEMSFATFMMTNIIPQAPNVNQKAWAQLEVYCRDLVKKKQQHLYIVAGPWGQGGTGSNGYKNTTAGGRVTVPAMCWKVIVVVPGTPGDDLVKINATTRVIAVIMPNDNDAVGEAWAKFRVSPAEIEKQTGLKFFTALSEEVAQSLRQKVDDARIAAPRPLTHDGG